MNVKRCKRCGGFFVSDSDTCELCESKDRNDVKTIRSYFEENEGIHSISELAIQTNIAERNINRLLGENAFGDLKIINSLNNIN